MADAGGAVEGNAATDERLALGAGDDDAGAFQCLTERYSQPAINYAYHLLGAYDDSDAAGDVAGSFSSPNRGDAGSLPNSDDDQHDCRHDDEHRPCSSAAIHAAPTLRPLRLTKSIKID